MGKDKDFLINLPLHSENIEEKEYSFFFPNIRVDKDFLMKLLLHSDNVEEEEYLFLFDNETPPPS